MDLDSEMIGGAMGYVVSLVIAGILGAVVIALLVRYLYRRGHPKVDKTAGRDAHTQQAVRAVRSFARSNSFKFIGPATYERGGRVTRLDAVVVGYFGVLGIQALGYNGEIYGTADEARWLQVAADGTRTHFPNPVDETAEAVRVLRDALMEGKQRKVPVEVLCVFCGSKVQLALPRAVEYYTIKTLKKQLRKEKYLDDTGLELEQVEQALRNAIKPEG